VFAGRHVPQTKDAATKEGFLDAYRLHIGCAANCRVRRNDTGLSRDTRGDDYYIPVAAPYELPDSLRDISQEQYARQMDDLL